MWKLASLLGTAVVTLVAGVAVWWVMFGEQPENLNISPQQWKEDLQYLARELPRKHANAFHFTSREEFEKAVSELDAQIDQSNSDAIWVGMQRIVSLVGDAPTYLQTPQDSAGFPIDVARFEPDYRIVSVVPGLEKALGARILKIDNMPVEQVARLCKELFSRDENPGLAIGFVNDALTTGGTLHGLGILENRNTVRYTLVDDSAKQFTVEVHPLAPGAHVSPVRPYTTVPLYLQNPGDPFSCTYMAAWRTLYCNVRIMRDLSKPAGEMLNAIGSQHPLKLVIDLRLNHGGDYSVGEKYLIHPVRDLPSINQKGHLFVLVGANTFSAAMNNAAQFRSQTSAILVGQEIGEKPNSYQEPRSMVLPNSHLTVRYSTRLYRFAAEGVTAIRPDQEIAPTWDDYQHGVDPVLEWVLKYSAQ
jgi:hypothetical protein